MGFDYINLLYRIYGDKIWLILLFSHRKKAALGQRGFPLVDIFGFEIVQRGVLDNRAIERSCGQTMITPVRLALG